MITGYRVRHYDGFDRVWMDVGGPCTLQAAQDVWLERTKNGTKATKFGDIDYYAIWDKNGIRSDLIPETVPMFTDDDVKQLRDVVRVEGPENYRALGNLADRITKVLQSDV